MTFLGNHYLSSVAENFQEGQGKASKGDRATNWGGGGVKIVFCFIQNREKE